MHTWYQRYQPKHLHKRVVFPAVGVIVVGGLLALSPLMCRDAPAEVVVTPTPEPLPIIEETPVISPEPQKFDMAVPLYIPCELSSEISVSSEPEEAPVDQEALELLACAIYQEAGSNVCSDTSRIAVGCVILNRVAHPQFPDTIEGVLTGQGQYGLFWKTGVIWPERAEYEPEAVERAYRCAERVLRGETPDIEGWSSEIIWQAEFKQGTETVAYIEGHYFCK